MKILLILLNLALALGCVWSFSKWFPSGKNEEMSLPQRDRTVKAAAKAPVNTAKEYTLAEAENIVLNKNLFDPTRCPAAANFRGGTTGQLQLVGVFEIDGEKGAVITQKAAVRRNQNPFRMQRTQTTASTASNARYTVANTAGGNAKKSVNQFGEAAPEVRSSPRQYYRVGDTLPNGYTLVSVERDRAVLARGSGGRMELTLEDASVNQPPVATVTRRPNQFQQFLNNQNTQMQQQQMMMQFMGEMMRRNFQNNRGGSSGGGVQISGGSRSNSTSSSSSSRGSSSSSSSSSGSSSRSSSR